MNVGKDMIYQPYEKDMTYTEKVEKQISELLKKLGLKRSDLSKAQEKALVAIILDEYRGHKKEYSDMRVIWGPFNVIKSTLMALIKKGLLIVNDNDLLDFTDTGRELAILLLIEPARKEMEAAFEYMDMEVERVASALKIKQAIMQEHGLFNWEVEVTAYYRLRDMSLRYSIDLVQKRVGRPLSNLARIGYSGDEYAIDTTATSLTAHNAKRMAELMLIAVQIIESDLLEGKEVVADGDEIGVIELELLGKLSRRRTAHMGLNLAAWIAREKPAIERLRSEGYISGQYGRMEITEAGRAILNRSQ